MSALIIMSCTLCGAFDVALYDEVKSLGARCVDRKACDRRRTSLAPGPAPGNASKGDSDGS